MMPSVSSSDVRLPGQYFDEETELHYNYFRDYDPSTGRYIESDPVGLKAGTNIYAYVSNNPIINVNPLGLAQIVYRKLILDENGKYLYNGFIVVVSDPLPKYVPPVG